MVWVYTGAWSRDSSSEPPRVLIFSDRGEGEALGDNMTCKLTPVGHSPHVPLRIFQEGFPQLGLRELVYSDQLTKKWLEVLPNTTILDVGRRDLEGNVLRGDHYHRYIVRAIGALEKNARDLLRTPQMRCTGGATWTYTTNI